MELLLILVAVPLHAQAPQTATSQTVTPTAPGAGPVTLTLADAINRAKTNSPIFHAALTEFGLAKEDRVQTRAAMLPTIEYGTSFTYTQGNGTVSGVVIANNGVHEYVSTGVLHEAIGFGSYPDYKRTVALQALAQARAEIARRGLVLTISQLFYGLLAAQERTANVQRATQEAQHFLDLSKKLEEGGEVAHSDVVKAQIQANDATRLLQDTRLAEENARLSLAVLVFPNFFQDFTLADDLISLPALPDRATLENLAKNNNPELQGAFAALEAANNQLSVARAGHLPTFTVDFFYGIDANQYAHQDRAGFNNLGYWGIATLNVPVFSWGATQSKVKQAKLQRNQAQIELSSAQRVALSDFQSFYSEAQTSFNQLATLRNSADLAADSLRLTTLRYQSGEATALEVVDAQNTLTTAANGLHDGEVRYHVALANLQTLTGQF